jgi:hypothetical protein
LIGNSKWAHPVFYPVTLQLPTEKGRDVTVSFSFCFILLILVKRSSFIILEKDHYIFMPYYNQFIYLNVDQTTCACVHPIHCVPIQSLQTPDQKQTFSLCMDS